MQFAVAYHIITITNHFRRCSVVINLDFNAAKPVSIVSERTVKINYGCAKITVAQKLFISNIWGEL
jgi:hypothetical protein